MAGLTPQQIQQVKALPIVYDRLRVLVDGLEYLKNGFIRDMRIASQFRSKTVAGFSRDGAAVALQIGGFQVAYAWNEILGQADGFLSWNAFLRANPNVTLTLIPVTVEDVNSPAAPQFTIYNGTVLQDVTILQAGESTEAMRSLVFESVRCSNITD